MSGRELANKIMDECGGKDPGPFRNSVVGICMAVLNEAAAEEPVKKRRLLRKDKPE